jgi:succinate-semialdehyde dehydrogenase/glutarate-semialdehyde dehydrogenase
MKVHPLYLNGAFVTTGRDLPVRNPATGETFARISTCGRAEVAQALADAQAAFPAWRALTGRARGDVLLRIAAEVERRKDEFARTITLENGKPLAQAAGEVAMTIDHLRWFAEEARRGYGRIIPPQADGKRHLVTKVPIGVSAAISPWNFPIVLGVRKVAPALAAGCPSILKPASATPLCAVLFAECVHAAGVPKGVFQLVAGSAAEIAGEFLANPICRKISFTGSTEVGRSLVAAAAEGVKPLSLELGGHSPLIVFDDADLNVAVEGAMIAKYRNGGQSCIAANRLYVQRGIWDAFLAAFTARVAALRVGPGVEPGVDVGPLINPAAADDALAHVADAQERGAQLVHGGRRRADLGPAFIEPTILTGVPADALGMRDETFAPVAYVNVFDTEAEVIARANDTRYGLAAYVFTRDLDRAFRLMEALEAGMIGINDPVPTTSNAPFGGSKQSGWGRELGTDGMDAYLETRHVSLVVR